MTLRWKCEVPVPVAIAKSSRTCASRYFNAATNVAVRFFYRDADRPTTMRLRNPFAFLVTFVMVPH